MDTDPLLQAARARDEILDQWMFHCAPMDQILVARWITLGEETDIIPRPLRASQARVMEEIAKMEGTPDV